MVSYTDEQRDSILREARITIRARRPRISADADGWDGCQPAAAGPILASRDQAAVAAPIIRGRPATSTADLVAAAAASSSPWSARMLRERAELELAELERRAADAERRQVEQRARAARTSDDMIATLRAETADLGSAANKAVSAILDRMDAMSAEIAALRNRCEVLEGRVSNIREVMEGRKARGTKSKLPRGGDLKPGKAPVYARSEPYRL
jgi:hypothetical protein